MTSKIAVYPGSFDPFTLGHLDVVARSAKLFDQVYVAIGKSAGKVPLFDDEQRQSLIKASTAKLPGVTVAIFDGLAVDFAKQVNATALVRGIRSVSDFTYEMQMAVMNRSLAGGIETVFIPTHQELSHVSASLVRDIARHGGPVEKLVPPQVVKPLQQKFAGKS